MVFCVIVHVDNNVYYLCAARFLIVQHIEVCAVTAQDNYTISIDPVRLGTRIIASVHWR